jgi:hypothetical protein
MTASVGERPEAWGSKTHLKATVHKPIEEVYHSGSDTALVIGLSVNVSAKTRPHSFRNPQ